MAYKYNITALLIALLTTLAAAQQQGVLSNGNSNLPSCGTSCPLLIQASQACNGENEATQAAWICFCQSAYLTDLFSSAVGICDSVCTNPSDNAQVSTWYKSNCGTDHGASEHPDTGAATTSAAAGGVATTSGAAAATSSSSSSGGSSSSNSGSTSSSAQSGDWWSNHYKWVIMLIVLAILLPLIAFIAVCLKRRHDRKQDQIRGGFNAGITTRSAGGPRDGPMSNPNFNASGPVASAVDGSGRNSPARTREAFMPYGYGYSRSETRLGSRQGVPEHHRGSPLARGDIDSEKDAISVTPEQGKKKSRRVLVRERSTEDSQGIEMEKGPM